MDHSRNATGLVFFSFSLVTSQMVGTVVEVWVLKSSLKKGGDEERAAVSALNFVSDTLYLKRLHPMGRCNGLASDAKRTVTCQK